jgi:hypothetical protein
MEKGGGEGIGPHFADRWREVDLYYLDYVLDVDTPVG